MNASSLSRPLGGSGQVANAAGDGMGACEQARVGAGEDQAGTSSNFPDAYSADRVSAAEREAGTSSGCKPDSTCEVVVDSDSGAPEGSTSKQVEDIAFQVFPDLSERWGQEWAQKQRGVGRSAAWLNKLTHPARGDASPDRITSAGQGASGESRPSTTKSSSGWNRPLFLVADSNVLTSSRSKFSGGGLCLRPQTAPATDELNMLSSDGLDQPGRWHAAGRGKHGAMGTLLLLPVLCGQPSMASSRSVTPTLCSPMNVKISRMATARASKLKARMSNF